MLTRTPLLVESDLARQRQDERDRRRRRRERGEEKRTRILYHIGKKPAIPQPARSAHRNTGPQEIDREEGHWYRKGREPAESGAFFTTNPLRVAATHGVGRHNVYTYKIPERVIRKSGGVRNFDKAPELLVPKKHWRGIKLVGKRETEQDFKERDRLEKPVIMGNPARAFMPQSKKQQRRNKKAQDIEARREGRKRTRRRREGDLGRRQQRYRQHESLGRTPLLDEALKVRRQSSKERMAKKRPSNLFAARRSAKFLWQKLRREWSKKNPQYIFRKGRLIFVPPEKRRQLKSKVKGRIVMRANFPGA